MPIHDSEGNPIGVTIDKLNLRRVEAQPLVDNLLVQGLVTLALIFSANQYQRTGLLFYG